MNPLDAVAASSLASASILAALVGELQHKGVLSDEEVRAVYEQALLLLEEMRGAGDDELTAVVDEARRVIEGQL